MKGQNGTEKKQRVIRGVCLDVRIAFGRAFISWHGKDLPILGDENGVL